MMWGSTSGWCPTPSTGRLRVDEGRCDRLATAVDLGRPPSVQLGPTVDRRCTSRTDRRLEHARFPRTSPPTITVVSPQLRRWIQADGEKRGPIRDRRRHPRGDHRRRSLGSASIVSVTAPQLAVSLLVLEELFTAVCGQQRRDAPQPCTGRVRAFFRRRHVRELPQGQWRIVTLRPPTLRSGG